MTSAEHKVCPQCLFQNEVEIRNCQLCDWQLISEDEYTKTTFENYENLHTKNNSFPLSLAEQAEMFVLEQSIVPDTFNSAELAHFQVHEVLGQGGMGAVF